MQIDAIYRRSMIQTIAGKAISDLRSGGERELRNVIELCRGRSMLPEYRRLWTILEDILRLPGQQYGALLSRAANDVDINCLKTLIANLGLHAYATGSETLRNNWGAGAASVYWLEILDETAKSDSLRQTVSSLQQQGTSSFLCRVERETELREILRLAGQNRQCVFILLCRGLSWQRADWEDMTALGNVIPLLAYADVPSLAGEFKQAGILFGYYRSYQEIESLEKKEQLLQQCMEAGCFLGVYEGSRQDTGENQDLFYYAILKKIRQRGAKDILLADLWRDRDSVQKLLLHEQAPAGGAWSGKSSENRGTEKAEADRTIKGTAARAGLSRPSDQSRKPPRASG